MLMVTRNTETLFAEFKIEKYFPIWKYATYIDVGAPDELLKTH